MRQTRQKLITSFLWRYHDKPNGSWSINILSTLERSKLGCRAGFQLLVCGVYLLSSHGNHSLFPIDIYIYLQVIFLSIPSITKGLQCNVHIQKCGQLSCTSSYYLKPVFSMEFYTSCTLGHIQSLYLYNKLCHWNNFSLPQLSPLQNC